MICSQQIVVPELQVSGFELLVNGIKGEVTVPLDTDVLIRVQGADPVDDIVITNITAFPDINLCQGDSDSNGVFECTVRFTENATVELKAFEDCALGICLKESNVVKISAGTGDPSGGGGTGTMILVGMGLLAAAFLFGSSRRG